MGKNVITIPATISKFTATPLTSTAKRKVAAYARVSTDHEEQQSSYDAQVDYYTNYIRGRACTGAWSNNTFIVFRMIKKATVIYITAAFPLLVD